MGIGVHKKGGYEEWIWCKKGRLRGGGVDRGWYGRAYGNSEEDNG
jgi:hypothetical protein